MLRNATDSYGKLRSVAEISEKILLYFGRPRRATITEKTRTVLITLIITDTRNKNINMCMRNWWY